MFSRTFLFYKNLLIIIPALDILYPALGITVILSGAEEIDPGDVVSVDNGVYCEILVADCDYAVVENCNVTAVAADDHDHALVRCAPLGVVGEIVFAGSGAIQTLIQ